MNPFTGLGLFVLLSASIAHAQVQSVTTSARSSQITGNLDPGNLQGTTQTSRLEQTIAYKVDGIAQTLMAKGSFTRAQPNYSNVLIENRDGTQTPLSTLPAGQVTDEYSAGAELSWTSGPHVATLAWAGAASPSPFAVQSLTAGFTEGFFEKTTLVGGKVGGYLANQPQTYYIGADFATHASPTLIHGNDESLFVEQVLTDRWKVSLEGSTGIRVEDRPRNVGATLRQGYAIFDSLFTQVALSRLSELRSYALLDNRGYFTLTSAEFTLTAEPLLDCLVSASYGYVVENEADPRTGREVQVGSDQYGLGAKYRRGSWSVDLKSGYRKTNTALTDLSVGGGLTWMI